MSFLLVDEDLDECLVEGILAEGFDGRRYAVHVLLSIKQIGIECYLTTNAYDCTACPWSPFS